MTCDPGQDRVGLPPFDSPVRAAPAPVRTGDPTGYWCERHNLPAACCLYCVTPGLLDEDRALLEPGEWALCGAVWLEVVRRSDGGLGLEPIGGTA